MPCQKALIRDSVEIFIRALADEETVQVLNLLMVGHNLLFGDVKLQMISNQTQLVSVGPNFELSNLYFQIWNISRCFQVLNFKSDSEIPLWTV